MKNKKYIIILIISIVLLTSTLFFTKNISTKKKNLKELNYDVTYRQAFPDNNLRKSVLICILRNKCNDYDPSIYNYQKYYDTLNKWPSTTAFVNQYYNTFSYQTSISPLIHDADLEIKSNEKIRKEDLDKLKILIPHDFTREITSLNGVEYLTNLKAVLLTKVKDENIDFSNNLLLERVLINISMPSSSHYKNIKSINISQNNLLKEISTTLSKEDSILDYSHLTNLETLIIRDSKIKSIKLPDNVVRVNLIDNKISEINLENKRKLESFFISNNPIREVNLDSLVKLKVLGLDNTHLNQTLSFNNNVELEEAYLRLYDGNIERLDFSNNLKLKKLYVLSKLKDINVKNNLDLTHLTLEENKLEELDLSNNAFITDLNIDSNHIKNLKMPNNIIGATLQEIKFKVKKNSYTKLPILYNDTKVYLDDSGNFTRNTDDYLFKNLGLFNESFSKSLNNYNYIGSVKVEVIAGEEHNFTPIINQGNYKPEIEEEISDYEIKKMITNLPHNIKNFEVLNPKPTKFSTKGANQKVKVRVTFSDDTFKEFEVPINIYEKRYIIPTISLEPNPLEILENQNIMILVKHNYSKEEEIDEINFIKYVKDNYNNYQYNNLPSGLVGTNGKITGNINYNFIGTEEEHQFNFSYNEVGEKYNVNIPINIKLLRDTDKDKIADKFDDDKDGDGYSNAVEIAKGSDPYDKNSTPDMTKKRQLDELVKQLEKLIDSTKNNPFNNKNKLDVDNLKNNVLPDKENKKNIIKNSYDDTTADSEIEKLKKKVQKEIDELKDEINKLRDKANFDELDKEIAKPIEDIYTIETLRPLKEKIEEAKNISRDTATQDEVDDMTEEIKKLRRKLKINKEKLKEKIDELETNINDGKCIGEECNKTLTEAKDLYKKTDITKDEMLDMINRINNLLNKNSGITNPKTGIKTYIFIIFLILGISFILLKKKKNYIR